MVTSNKPDEPMATETPSWGDQGKQLRVLSWNVNGLYRKLTDYEFLEYVSDYDLLLLSETWTSNKTAMNLEINGYTCEHVCGNKTPGAKKGRYSGGVSLYVKKIT